MGIIILENNSKKIIQEIKKIIPPLTGDRHKGQSGRVAVIGGSQEYSGAPYFSAISALKTGADLSHIICVPSASTVIKTYSPDLIVHPLLQESQNDDFKSVQEITNKIRDLLPRFHSIIIGPGLSRVPTILNTAELVIIEAIKLNIPLVIDADGLFLIQNSPDLVKGYKKAILTPNAVEFKRLCEAISLPESTPKETIVAELSQAFGGVTIIEKGPVDNISNGLEILNCSIPGGLKRCGGQGDILSGVLGTFIAWVDMYQDNSWSHDSSLDSSKATFLACWASCLITRASSSNSYKKHGRSTQTSDIIHEISHVFSEHFG